MQTKLGSLIKTPINLPFSTASKQTKQFGFSKHSQRVKTNRFSDFVAEVNPTYQAYKHCEVLFDVLERVASGEIKRLMVFMPPRHSKSETVSRLFAAYYLYKYPDRWVGLNSYAAELAYTLSRNARQNFVQIGGALSGSASAVKHWETQKGGGMWAAGVGGPITGKGFHLGIIDDPLKNAEDAASERIRAKQKDWFNSTFTTRSEPDAAVIIIQTRWHEDDLSGWLLDQETQDDYIPEAWHVVDMPAVYGETERKYPPTCTIEKDWRTNGEPLCPERYDLTALAKKKSSAGAYFWSALYDQKPKPKEGIFFNREWFEIVDKSPIQASRVRWWDFAASEDPGADRTASVRMALADGVYYVEHVVAGRWRASARNVIIKQTAEADEAEFRPHGLNVHTWGEQEPGSSGKEVAQAFVKMLAGHSVNTETSTGDKALRADPFSSQAEAGNVKIVRGEWNRMYLDELTSFPLGKHDDMVDCSSGSFNKLARMTDWYVF